MHVFEGYLPFNVKSEASVGHVGDYGGNLRIFDPRFECPDSFSKRSTKRIVILIETLDIRQPIV
jgi:hypothetical protein